MSTAACKTKTNQQKNPNNNDNNQAKKKQMKPLPVYPLRWNPFVQESDCRFSLTKFLSILLQYDKKCFHSQMKNAIDLQHLFIVMSTVLMSCSL